MQLVDDGQGYDTEKEPLYGMGYRMGALDLPSCCVLLHVSLGGFGSHCWRWLWHLPSAEIPGYDF
jgi:hypothetical protein